MANPSADAAGIRSNRIVRARRTSRSAFTATCGMPSLDLRQCDEVAGLVVRHRRRGSVRRAAATTSLGLIRPMKRWWAHHRVQRAAGRSAAGVAARQRRRVAPHPYAALEAHHPSIKQPSIVPSTSAPSRVTRTRSSRWAFPVPLPKLGKSTVSVMFSSRTRSALTAYGSPS